MAEALVLTSADSRDDLIVGLLMDSGLRLPVVARRARRSAKRAGHLDPVTRAEVVVRERGDGLATLEGATALEGFAIVKADLLRVALASAMAEVVTHVLAEHDGEPGLYPLLLRAWRVLDDPKRRPTEELLLLFELRALTLAGLMPEVADLPGLTDGAREALTEWEAGRWRALEAADRRRVATVLEALLTQQSGRPLRARAVLDPALDLSG